MSYSRILFTVLVGLLMISCTTDSIIGEEEEQEEEGPPVEEPITWEEQGLQGVEVLTVARAGDYLFAGTEEGLYRAYITEQLGWQHMGPGQDSVRVTDLIVFSGQELMVAAEGEKVLYKSEDGGETWEGWALDMPDETDYRNRLTEIEVNTANPDILFGLSGSVLRSEDRGETWEKVFKSAGSDFLYVSREYSNQVWTGGSTQIFAPYLIKSEDGGNNWENLSENIYRNSDGSVSNAIIFPENENIVMISSGQKSENGGETWEDAQEEFKGVSVFQISKTDNNKVYGSRINYTTLYLSVSEDFGETWEVREFEDIPLGMKIEDMISVMQNEEEVLYIATNKGMYSYKFEE